MDVKKNLVAVLSNDIAPSEDGSLVPDVFSESRVRAGVMLYRELGGAQMLFCGGYFHGKSAPSLASVLAKYAVNELDVPSNEAHVEEKSLTTGQNLDQAVWMARYVLSASSLHVVTNKHHWLKAYESTRRAVKKKTFMAPWECLTVEDIYARNGKSEELQKLLDGQNSFGRYVRHTLGWASLFVPRMEKLHDEYAKAALEPAEAPYLG